MRAAYDVFLSHAWADGDRPQQIADALAEEGLRVWFDAGEINDFASITNAVTAGLARSKALLAYYSKTYPLRRACQWELTAAFLAAQIEGDPRRRVLVINPENGTDHIHPIELRDAKSRKAPNDEGTALLELVRSVVQHVAALEGPLADIRPLTPPPWHGIKPLRYERFVGRFQEMWAMHSSLHETTVVQTTGASGQDIAQVTGLGGIAKSLLAREYALRFGNAYPGGIFWLSAYGNDDAKAALSDEGRDAERGGQLSNFAQDFGIDVTGKSAEDIRGALAREIDKRGQLCLWIVDDLPSGLNTQAFADWCAPHPLARTLITTRSRAYGALAKRVDLSALAPEEAYQLLTSRKNPIGEAEQEQARALAKDLGYHALALDVSASALVSYGGDAPYREFRKELSDKNDDALELSTELADALPNGHEASIAQTMLRSIRNLGEEGQDFLRLASVLAVAPIPASLVTLVLERADEPANVLGAVLKLFAGKSKDRRESPVQRQRKAFHDVTAASLAEISGEKQEARSVHTLVSRAVRFHQKNAPERAQTLRAAAVLALWAEIARAAEDPRLHKEIEFHVAHARQVAATPTTVNDVYLASWVARYDYARGAYASALNLWERELEFLRRELGPEHPQTLTSMNNLAETRRARGDWPRALELQEDVLAVRRRVLGPEHPETLGAMNNLATTLKAQGDFARARVVQEKVLDVSRRVLGPDHPDTLGGMNNLASTLRAQGDFAGAGTLSEAALDVCRRVVGPEHRYTLIAMHNVAAALHAQGDSARARELQEETLGISRRVLGPEHPDTLNLMNDLAATFSVQGDFARARKLQEEVLRVIRDVLGPEHPDTLNAMNNLGVTLQAQGDLAAARKLQEETLAIRRRVLGPDHPDTTVSAWWLCLTLQALGEHTEVWTVLRGDLLWLVDRNPATLGAAQREALEWVNKVMKEVDSG